MKKCLVTITFGIILSLLLITNSESSLINSDKYTAHNITRPKRQTNCPGQFQYRCNTGECITEDLYCDGVINCKDGSDETEDCKNIQCLPYLFRCKYGACINGDYECDGKTDCKDNSDETSPKCSKSSKCGSGKFRCKSGQCISDSNLCDGKADCYDKSDESSEACSDFICPGFTYQCAYGACVSGSSKCNGRSDCVDGSDEIGCRTTSTTRKPTTTTTKRTISPQIGCSLPNFPQNGFYNVSGLSSFSPGQKVSGFTVAQFSCKEGYKLHPLQNKLIICQSGLYTWDKTFPECRRSCPPLTNEDSDILECSIEGKSNPGLCREPVEGVVVKFSCKEFFEPLDQFATTTRCRNGAWDRQLSRCKAVCGKRRGAAQTNVIGGKVALKHDFPWHVGLYESQTKDHICGGSMITRKFIVTAAHCVAHLENGVSYPKENYLVAVGKYYRPYDDPNDKNYAQYPRIKKIYVHPDYRGETQQHDADLALIELEDILNITNYVQPVCINLDENNKNDDLIDNQTGLVIGWGYTSEDGKPSNVLKVLEVPYLSRRKCYELVSDAFKPYITRDKLCAGFEDSGQSVCLGDSGGGLVFDQQVGNLDKKYFIKGIVSVSAKSKTTSGCDSNSYAGYTDLSLSDYKNFISELSY